MTNTETSSSPDPATVAAPGAPVAPRRATSSRKPKAKKRATRGRKAAKTAKPAPTRKPAGARRKPAPASKKAAILELLGRGATLAQIASATGWQNHSIRGFISGTVSKRLGLKVESTRDEQGQRHYRILK